MALINSEFTKMIQHHAVDKNLNIPVKTGIEASKKKNKKIKLKLNIGKSILADAITFAMNTNADSLR